VNWLKLRDIYGRTLLHDSVHYDSDECMRALLCGIIEKKLLSDKDFSEYINAQDNVGDTVLHLAALRWSVVCVRYLLSFPDIKIDVQNRDKYTPVDMATNVEIIRMIREHQDISITKPARKILFN